MLVGVTGSDERGTRRPQLGPWHHAGEVRALAREPVERRRRDHRIAGGTDRVVSMLVGQDQENVRLRRGRLLRASSATAETGRDTDHGGVAQYFTSGPLHGEGTSTQIGELQAVCPSSWIKRA